MSRPSGISDALWMLIDLTWNADPEKRPLTSMLVHVTEQCVGHASPWSLAPLLQLTTGVLILSTYDMSCLIDGWLRTSWCISASAFIYTLVQASHLSHR